MRSDAVPSDSMRSDLRLTALATLGLLFTASAQAATAPASHTGSHSYSAPANTESHAGHTVHANDQDPPPPRREATDHSDHPATAMDTSTGHSDHPATGMDTGHSDHPATAMDTSTGHSDHPATGMDMDTGHSDHPDMDTGTGMAGHDMGADPLLLMLNVHELELREHSGSDVLNWDMDAWYGADLHKVWLKTEGEARRGSVAEQEWQLLYRRAASAFGDWQLGVRHDSGEVADQDWLALGWVGTLPYQVHMDTAVFAGEAGQTALRIKLEQEWLLSQRWALSPSLELNLHGHTDRQRQIGSGLSSTDAGLRLKYRAGLKLHPYIGVTYGRYSGTTADFMAAAGEQREQWQGVLGVSFWY